MWRMEIKTVMEYYVVIVHRMVAAPELLVDKYGMALTFDSELEAKAVTPYPHYKHTVVKLLD
jgi:hypothetical protein